MDFLSHLDPLAGATLLLAAVTAWVALETRRMANETRKSIELQSQPYLALDGVELGALPLHPAFRVTLILSNPGQVLVNYEVETLDATFPTSSKSGAPGSFHARSVLHPKITRKFFSGGFPLTASLVPPVVGSLTVRIAFWSTLFKIEHLDAVLELRYNSANSPGGLEWVYVQGPTYT